MSISVFDLFSIGIGPSSSHTVGPMRAANLFTQSLITQDLLASTNHVSVELFGSLGATGKGHGSDKAILLGLQGESAESVDVDGIPAKLEQIVKEGQLKLVGLKIIDFNPSLHLIMHRQKSLPYHANGLSFEAFNSAGHSLLHCTYYSVGGGFVIDEHAATLDAQIVEDSTVLPYPFDTAKALLQLCDENQISISDLMLSNECVRQSEEQVRQGLLGIWQVMQECVKKGCVNEGILPGGLKVKRRAAALYKKLSSQVDSTIVDPLAATD